MEKKEIWVLEVFVDVGPASLLGSFMLTSEEVGGEAEDVAHVVAKSARLEANRRWRPDWRVGEIDVSLHCISVSGENIDRAEDRLASPMDSPLRWSWEVGPEPVVARGGVHRFSHGGSNGQAK